jgi:methylenetetrahydrofolate reductase (NADPH)
VPHIAARRLANFTQASDFLLRAVAQAGVDRVLLIGGDNNAMGPFRSSFDLLATGVVERQGVGHVAFAGYPEGHPAIDASILDAALQAKVALARQRGLQVSLVSQFSFESVPILHWLASLHQQGIDCPVRIGVAGPASVATLAKYAVRCGIGASLRVLARGHTAFARILTEAGPEALIAALVADDSIQARFEGLHVFTFGGVRHTADWIRASAGDSGA